ncbi:TIGR04222 domain-containing membrane protein [Streptomyces sp. AB3(2024)]|uniref:TIGR04222 domain-containing membrane protein n=1 Tax=Streptomyces sp. AB3(2024) TaxID=3317321 RepID=UPI0035A392CA
MNAVAIAVWAAVLGSSALLLRALFRARPRVPGTSPTLHDLSEAAFLAGGPGAVVDAALVSLLGDGRLAGGGPGIVQARPGAPATDPAERAVLLALRQAPSGWLYQVRYAAMLDPSVQETGDGLAARGLIAPPGTGRGLRRWGLVQALVCGMLVPVSLPLTFVAWALDPAPQVPFILKVLPALLAGIAVGGVCAKRARRRITPAGRAALAGMRARYAGDPAEHVQTALFGLRGLRDPELRRQLLPAARSTRLAAAQSRNRTRTGTGPHGSRASSTSHTSHTSRTSSTSSADLLPVFWCAASDGGSSTGSGGCGSSGSGCGGSSGSGCGGGGSSCGSSGSSCGSSGSSCSGSSSSCGGSSSSCSSSSSSCGSSS